MSEQALCVYCQQRPATTDDHIPPKQLWVKPRPSDLVTVPACLRCNKGFEKDDAYFRDCIALEQRSAQHPDALAVTENVLRSLARPRGRGYTRYFLSQAGVMELRSALGLYTGHQGGFHVDLDRLGRTVARITRGLYFHECGEPLPLSYEVRGFFPEGFRHLATWDMAKVREGVVIPALRNRVRSVGRGVLRYWYARSDTDSRTVAWVLEFYGGIRCLGASVPAVRPGNALVPPFAPSEGPLV
jgi:hypothetical protein